MANHNKYYHCSDFRPFLNHPEKLNNPDDKPLVARSGLEMKWFTRLDNMENVLKWSSERVVVPYEKPIFILEDRPEITHTEERRYFVDLWVLWKTGDRVVELLAEIKPESMCYPPKEPKINNKKSMSNYYSSMQTYLINRSKWVSTHNFCQKLFETKQRQIDFVVFNDNMKIESITKILGIK